MTVVALKRPTNLEEALRTRAYLFQAEESRHLMAARAAILDSGLDEHKIALETGLAYQTVRNLTSGKTKNPHNLTVELVAAALGYDITWVRR